MEVQCLVQCDSDSYGLPNLAPIPPRTQEAADPGRYRTSYAVRETTRPETCNELIRGSADPGKPTQDTMWKLFQEKDSIKNRPLYASPRFRLQLFFFQLQPQPRWHQLLRELALLAARREGFKVYRMNAARLLRPLDMACRTASSPRALAVRIHQRGPLFSGRCDL